MTKGSAWACVLASGLIMGGTFYSTRAQLDAANERIRAADDRARKAEAAYEHAKWLAWEGQWNARTYERSFEQTVADCALFLSIDDCPQRGYGCRNE